jgi:hypothetical protein
MRMWHANNYPYSWHLPGGIMKDPIWDSRFWGSDVTLGCPLVYKHNCKDSWAGTYFSQHGKYFKYFQKCLWSPMCPVWGSLKTWMRCFRSKLPFPQICSCVSEWVGSYWFNYSNISLWSPSHCISYSAEEQTWRRQEVSYYITINISLSSPPERDYKNESCVCSYTEKAGLSDITSLWVVLCSIPGQWINYSDHGISLFFSVPPLNYENYPIWAMAVTIHPTCQYHVVTDSLRTATGLTSQPRWQVPIWDGCSSIKMWSKTQTFRRHTRQQRTCVRFTLWRQYLRLYNINEWQIRRK